MRRAIRNFVNDESGLELVEWALVSGLVVAVGAAVFTAIGLDLGILFGYVQLATGAAAS